MEKILARKKRWYTLLTIILLFLVNFLIFSLVLRFLTLLGYYEINLLNSLIIPIVIIILSIAAGLKLSKFWWNYIYVEKKHWIFKTKWIKNKTAAELFEKYL